MGMGMGVPRFGVPGIFLENGVGKINTCIFWGGLRLSGGTEQNLQILGCPRKLVKG